MSQFFNEAMDKSTICSNSILSTFKGNMRIFIFLPVLLILLLPQSVFAHAKSTSYSTWEIDGSRVRVTARIPWIELQRSLLSAALSSPEVLVPGSESERELETYLTTHLSLFAEGH